MTLHPPAVWPPCSKLRQEQPSAASAEVPFENGVESFAEKRFFSGGAKGRGVSKGMVGGGEGCHVRHMDLNGFVADPLKDVCVQNSDIDPPIR